MQLLILCGGLGTRLKPITEKIPKPMVEINGKPFLEYLINYYRKQNINEFILSVGYLKEQIIAYFGNGEKWGVNIKYCEENEPLGTGGAIYKAHNLLKENFIVVNGDTFMEINLEDIIKFHEEKYALCTVALKRVKRKQNSGYIEINDQNEIISFKSIESSIEQGYINAGLYIINKKLLKKMPNEKFSIENDFFNKIQKQIYGYEVKEGYFIDIGTFDTYNQFVNEFNKISHLNDNKI